MDAEGPFLWQPPKGAAAANTDKLHVKAVIDRLGGLPTTQSKLLETKGLLRRKPSPTDARVVRMSLTDKTQKHLASLAEQHKAIREYVFEEFDEAELASFTAKLVNLKQRLEKACVKVSMDV